MEAARVRARHSRSPADRPIIPPSPERISASPMMVGEATTYFPADSDEGYAVSDSGETSRRSTASRIDTSDLMRDADLKNKYPELFAMIAQHGRVPSEIGEISDARGELFKEALQLLAQVRKQETTMKEMRKAYEQLTAVNRQIRETYVKIYAKAEQEEEYISNCLLKRIQKLKNDKETLAQKYEQEEEFLTNDLMRRIQQLQSERDQLEGKMKTEQGALIDNLLQTIRRMETEMASSRKNMDRMRKEKIDQENALEHEQELLFNTLGKQMDQLNNDKRKLQVTIQKAYQGGFIDQNEMEGAIQPTEPLVLQVDRPPVPLSPSADMGRLHAENQRLRAQLRRTEHSLADYQQRDALKTGQIRQLEDALASVLKEKDDFMRSIDDARRGFASRVDGVVGGLPVGPSAFPPRDSPGIRDSPRSTRESSLSREGGRDMAMGPPSVPHTPNGRHGDYDMDDNSSRGSLSQNDFHMN